MRRVVVGALSLGLALTFAALGSVSSAAAAGSIGISDDGVTYGSTYPGTLFDSVAHLVPTDSDSESFFIRNDTGSAGFLRVVLRNVVFSDAAYGAALSVSASTPSKTGTAQPLTAATPCVVLVEGQTVQPGEIVPISAVVALGDLTGTAGQNATAEMSLRVELHDTSTGSLPTNPCILASPGTDVIVVPPAAPTGAGARPPAGTQPGDFVVVPNPGVVEPGEEPGSLPAQPQGNVTGMDPNTWLLYEERWWFVMLLAFVVGSLCFMIVDWRRQWRARHDGTEASA